jgi:hypothetical protein
MASYDGASNSARPHQPYARLCAPQIPELHHLHARLKSLRHETRSQALAVRRTVLSPVPEVRARQALLKLSNRFETLTSCVKCYTVVL